MPVPGAGPGLCSGVSLLLRRPRDISAAASGDAGGGRLRRNATRDRLRECRSSGSRSGLARRRELSSAHFSFGGLMVWGVRAWSGAVALAACLAARPAYASGETGDVVGAICAIVSQSAHQAQTPAAFLARLIW